MLELALKHGRNICFAKEGNVRGATPIIWRETLFERVAIVIRADVGIGRGQGQKSLLRFSPATLLPHCLVIVESRCAYMACTVALGAWRLDLASSGLGLLLNTRFGWHVQRTQSAFIPFIIGRDQLHGLILLKHIHVLFFLKIS